MSDKNWLSPQTVEEFKTTAPRRRKLRGRFSTYHQETVDFFNQRIAPHSRVLWIGLDAAMHSKGLVCRDLLLWELDPTPDAVAPARGKLVSSFAEATEGGPLDYVVLPHTLQFLDDIQGFFETLHEQVSEQTRIIVVQYNFLWAPVIKFTQLLGFKSPTPTLNWLNTGDIENFLLLTEYQTITDGYRCLLPIKIPLLTFLVNRYLAPIPLFAWACQKTFVTARPVGLGSTQQDDSVTIVVPARNEAGNIPRLLDRLPVIGKRCEIIFVEGHSKDNTWEAIQTAAASHPRRNLFSIQTCQQTGVGKADAVRLGFSKAQNDVLMILDADMTVQPEDLEHFYRAWQRGGAEFLNGCRLVYQMESHAMQVLNIFFNKAFAVLISWAIGQRIKDSLCGTKALRRREYQRIRDQFAHLAKMDPFGDFELLLGASKLGLKISDVMVRYKARTYGQTNILRFRHGWQLLRLCWASWAEFK